MKALLILLALSITTFARATDYPVKNFSYIEESDFNTEVVNAETPTLVIFSNSSCLDMHTIPEHSCFLFEKKLDYYVPAYANRIKFVAADLYFQNYSLPQMYRISTVPTVILFINGREVARQEANITPFDFNRIQMNWVDDLLVRTLDMLKKVSTK